MRKDSIRSITENFGYDLFDQLKWSKVTGLDSLKMDYDDIGNTTSKSDVGHYYYNSTRIHAVDSISGSQDPGRQNIDYNFFNKPVYIADAEDSLNYTYDVLDNRIKATLYGTGGLVGTTWYAGLYEKTLENSVTKHYYYINGPDGPIALAIQTGGGTPVIYYLCKDHLGPITGVMESDGDLVEEYNYDPWGKRRNPTNWSYSNVPAATYTQHGFTGHEHLDMFNLINMNGRVYDSEIARFVSPDPIIQDPYNILSYTRYSYCLNNPLKYTDPSGYSYRRFWELEMIDREAYGQGAQFMNNYVGWWSQYQHNRSTINGPGMGNNGPGLNGVYYDWYSGKVRSTDNREIVNLGSVGVEVDWMTISYARNNPSEFHIGMVYFTDGTKVDWNMWSNATSSVSEGNTGSKMNTPLWTLYTSAVGTWGELLGESFKVNPVKIISKITGAIKTGGWIGEGISIGVAYKNLKNNPTSGNIARFQSSVGIAGMNVMKGVGSTASFFTSVADNAGAFNWYYNAYDKISNATGFTIIPPGLYPFPILIPKIKR